MGVIESLTITRKDCFAKTIAGSEFRGKIIFIGRNDVLISTSEGEYVLLFKENLEYLIFK